MSANVNKNLIYFYRYFIHISILITLLLSYCEKYSNPVDSQPMKGYLSGFVKDKFTARPLPSAVVLAIKNNVTDTTDEQGFFFLENLTVEIDTFKVSAEGYQTRYIPYEIQPDSQQIDFDLTGQENLYLYIGAVGGHDIYIVDVDRLEKVDRLYFEHGDINHLAITQGGSKLYISQTRDYGGGVYYLDIKTNTFYPTNMPVGIPKFSPSGELLWFTHQGIFQSDTLNDTATQIDTLSMIITSAFHPYLPVFYFTQFYNHYLYTYDYQQQMITDSLQLTAWDMAVTPDGSELYFVCPGSFLGFLNLNSGIVSRIVNVNPNGEIAITPDGQHVLVTDPGRDLPMIPGSGLITVVLTWDHSFDGYIDVRPLAGTNKATHRIVITPSGNYAFINDRGVKIFVVDIQNKIAMKTLEFWHSDGPLGRMVLGPKF